MREAIRRKSNVAAFAAMMVVMPITASTPALSADLGGDCCADLEERVAELEATAVRKGNRKVAVTISGQVSHTIMYWDDGARSDVYLADSGNFTSRWRLVGSAKISATLTAGFLYEFGASPNSTSAVNQGNGGDDLGATGGGSGQGGSPGNLALRDSTVWLRHSQLGFVQVGHGSTVTDNLILLDLSDSGMARTPDVALYGGGFVLREKGGGLASGTTWQALFRGDESFDTDRRNHVRWDSPTIAGFVINASWGEDNFWDVALKYAGEFGGFRLAFGVGYREDTEFNGPAGALDCATNCDRRRGDFLGSGSIIHVQSGLFVTGAFGIRENDNSTRGDGDFWYISGGVAKNFFGIGSTILYGEYSEHNDMVAGTSVNFGTPGTLLVAASEVTHWGIGIHQHIDAAALELFLTYKHFEADLRSVTGVNSNFDAFDTIIGGTRIRF